MEFIDIVAWIVLAVVALTLVAAVVALGAMPRCPGASRAGAGIPGRRPSRLEAWPP
ncbi:hypothetical protein [Methylobacterium frigidaeris]|uniref:Uncharacterized protein n=1 Tax=Methylobacterium frigidaeris TaxID=2038277 RepID=A0AA37HGN3_9HYPH|nr:hypothetical protein MPEAHAMD_5896 [Methylobacterium frigidaeris]